MSLQTIILILVLSLTGCSVPPQTDIPQNAAQQGQRLKRSRSAANAQAQPQAHSQASPLAGQSDVDGDDGPGGDDGAADGDDGAGDGDGDADSDEPGNEPGDEPESEAPEDEAEEPAADEEENSEPEGDLVATDAEAEPGVAPRQTYSLAGEVFKGPFLSQGQVEVTLLDEQLAPTEETWSTTIEDDTGRFSLPVSLPEGSRWVRIRGEGRYFDEFHDRESDAPIALEAIVDLTRESWAQVNILTDLAAPRHAALAREGRDAAAAKTQAEEELLGQMGLPQKDNPGFHKIRFGDSSQQLLLAATSLVFEGHEERIFGTRRQELRQQFGSGGKLEAAARDQFEKVRGRLAAPGAREKIRENLQRRFEDKGMIRTVEPFVVARPHGGAGTGAPKVGGNDPEENEDPPPPPRSNTQPALADQGIADVAPGRLATSTTYLVNLESATEIEVSATGHGRIRWFGPLGEEKVARKVTVKNGESFTVEMRATTRLGTTISSIISVGDEEKAVFRVRTQEDAWCDDAKKKKDYLRNCWEQALQQFRGCLAPNAYVLPGPFAHAAAAAHPAFKADSLDQCHWRHPRAKKAKDRDRHLTMSPDGSSLAAAKGLPKGRNRHLKFQDDLVITPADQSVCKEIRRTNKGREIHLITKNVHATLVKSGRHYFLSCFHPSDGRLLNQSRQIDTRSSCYEREGQSFFPDLETFLLERDGKVYVDAVLRGMRSRITVSREGMPVSVAPGISCEVPASSSD